MLGWVDDMSPNAERIQTILTIIFSGTFFGVLFWRWGVPMFLGIPLGIISGVAFLWVGSKLIDLMNRGDRVTPPLNPRARERVRADTEEEIQRLLEQGMYEVALGLVHKPQPVEIKNKIIELREVYPDLSALLVEAEGALIRNPKQYKKDCKLRDGIRRKISQRWGEVALEFFPGSQIWRMIKDKPLLGKDVSTFMIERVNSIVQRIPALQISKGPEVTATAFRMDCQICQGGKNTPECDECGGSRISPVSSQCGFCKGRGEISPLLLESLRSTGVITTLKGVASFKYGSKISCPICDGRGYMSELCTKCNGTGKYCQCHEKITFHIPSQARVGQIIKAVNSTSDKPHFARLVE